MKPTCFLFALICFLAFPGQAQERTQIYNRTTLFTQGGFFTFFKFNIVHGRQNPATVLRDSTERLTFSEVRRQWSFSSKQQDSILLDPHSIYWLQLRFSNDSSAYWEPWIYVSQLGWDSLVAFLPDHEGNYREQAFGVDTPLKEKDPPYWLPMFRCSIGPRDTVELYLRLTPSKPGWLAGAMHEPSIWEVDAASFQQNLPTQTAQTAFLHGLLFIQCVFFFAIFIFTREKSTFFLALYIFGFLLYDIHETIFKEEFHFLFRYYETYANRFLRFPATWITHWGLLTFTALYLNISSVFPYFNKFIRVWLVLFGFICLFSYLDEETIFPVSQIYVFQFYRLGSFLMFLIVFFISVLALIKRTTASHLFFIGVLPLLTAGMLGILMVFGLIDSPVAYRHIFRLGNTSSIVLLSFITAFRVKGLFAKEKEADKLREMDEFKSRFYTNITHEFRTPLTVILGLTKNSIIQRNGQHLLRLVNQMMDLSKLENNALKLKLIQTDVIDFLRYVTASFHSLAEYKDIRLSFESNTPQLYMDFDVERLQEILNNLLSNAIKFTPVRGTITLQVESSMKTSDGELQIGDRLLIFVKDSGHGIAEDQLAFIFDRFYQSTSTPTKQAQGTGIGLALAKELVQLMGGTINVKSEWSKGSIFVVSLPITRQAELLSTHLSDLEISKQVHPSPDESFLGEVPSSQSLSTSPVLLIVEDNADVMHYLRSCLQDQYRLAYAANGQEGIDLALELLPDIIISDVMMPVKDGFELCGVLKEHEQTNHIPIILLTARADIESKIEGLKHGADAYLVKPFKKEELDIRLQKLIELRQNLQARYAKMDFRSEAGSHKEDAFVLKVKEIILKNLEREEFGIQELSQAVHFSRVHLHRKLKALTGKSTSHFVRQIRLQKAYQLLSEGEFNVTEVAYLVGFKDPAYFSKLFSKIYGKPPREVR